MKRAELLKQKYIMEENKKMDIKEKNDENEEMSEECIEDEMINEENSEENKVDVKSSKKKSGICCQNY